MDKRQVGNTEMQWPFDLCEDASGQWTIVDADSRAVLVDAFEYDNIKPSEDDGKATSHERAEARERMVIIMRALNRQLGPVVVTPDSNVRRLETGEEVELTLKVKARVLDDSDGHGLCYQLRFDSRDFINGRMVWVDGDEILRVEPVKP